MALPVVLVFFCLLVSNVYHAVGKTCNHRLSLLNTVRFLEALQSTSGSRVEPPWKLRRICILQSPNLGQKFTKNTWMVVHFFMCIGAQSHRKISKVPIKILNSQVSYQKMSIFKQAIKRSVPRSAFQVATSE